jgi:predicted anti-sigma-YlaC factor YlaD
MSDRNWDAEMKKIDRQLESVSDEAMFPTKTVKGAQAQVQNAAAQQSTSTWGVFLRLALTVALGVGMVFWPYSARCGLGLAGYLGAVTALVVSGVWSSAWTFRHRAARAHVLSLLLVTWGVVLGCIEVLPRAGYAKPTTAHPAGWACESK